MSNILFIDADGNPLYSCCDTEGVPSEGDKMEVEGVDYIVVSVKKIINKHNPSWRVTLR